MDGTLMHNVDALNGSLHAAQSASTTRSTARAATDRTVHNDVAPSRSTDSVELSPTALDSSRASAIARIREEIAAGTYLTDDRIDGAVQALLGELQ